MEETEELGKEISNVKTKAPLHTFVGRLKEAKAKTFGHRLRDEEVEKLMQKMSGTIVNADAKHLAKIWFTCRPWH